MHWGADRFWAALWVLAVNGGQWWPGGAWARAHSCRPEPGFPSFRYQWYCRSSRCEIIAFEFLFLCGFDRCLIFSVRGVVEVFECWFICFGFWGAGIVVYEWYWGFGLVVGSMCVFVMEIYVICYCSVRWIVCVLFLLFYFGFEDVFGCVLWMRLEVVAWTCDFVMNCLHGVFWLWFWGSQDGVFWMILEV